MGRLSKYRVLANDRITAALKFNAYYENAYTAGDTYLLTSQTVSTQGPNQDLTSGGVTRSYNANRELISESDIARPENSRFYANDAAGNALTVVRGNIEIADQMAKRIGIDPNDSRARKLLRRAADIQTGAKVSTNEMRSLTLGFLELTGASQTDIAATMGLYEDHMWNMDDVLPRKPESQALDIGSWDDEHVVKLTIPSRTPGKSSGVGLKVQERMRRDGLIQDGLDGPEFYSKERKRWYPLKDADMSHDRSAVDYWNKEGRYQGARSDPVRKFMNDDTNYTLEHRSVNRSEGARMRVQYKPPATPEEIAEWLSRPR